MSYSSTYTTSTTFTVTHARDIAAKVATDLKRIQRFYTGGPDDARIAQFEGEVVELLRHGYLGTVTYGFKRDGNWIEPTLRYTAQDLTPADLNDDPGRVAVGKDVSGAYFSSFLTYSAKWWLLTQAERDAFEGTLPLQRSGGSEPGVNGYFMDDRTYSAGGRSLARATVRSFT